jgi:hypothetical protein
MVLGLIVFLVLPGHGTAGATQPLAFHYTYPGKTCAETGPVHDGTQVEATTTGGSLVATGTLQQGITRQINGVSTCSYVVRVMVPKDVGTYYFRALGTREIYKVSRSTIDSTPNGWATLSTVAAGVVVLAWSGSAYAAY